MADYGLSPDGFHRKRLDALLSELRAEFEAVFGDNFNTAPESPDGQIIGLVSDSNAQLWEIAESSYNCFNPAAASGNQLSNLVTLNRLTRLPATPATTLLTLGGSQATLIPAGSLAKTADTGQHYVTTADATIDDTGAATVEAESVVYGAVMSVAGSITVIETPITGWDTVTNELDTSQGSDEETDVELRARRDQSTSRQAVGILDSIYSEVAQVPGVISVTVFENDTDAIDLIGLSPHSFGCVVYGGEDDAIAKAIFSKKSIGIKSFGNTLVDVPDDQGMMHSIGFERPYETAIYVTATLVITGDYPAGGDELAAQAVIDYGQARFGVNEDVIYSELYTPLNAIEGCYVSSLAIGTAPSPTGTDNIAIGVNYISKWDAANIVISSGGGSY